MQATYEKRTMELGQGPYFNMTSLTAFHPQHPHVRNGRVRENYEIIWIQEGEGNLAVNRVNYQVKANSLYCGAPGQLQQLNLDSSLKGWMISFNYDFIHQGYEGDGWTSAHILHEFMNFSTLQLPDRETCELTTLTEKMEFESTAGQQMNSEMLRFYLRIMLIHIRRMMKDTRQETQGVNNVVMKFLAQIETNFVTKKLVREYASMLCVTSNYLNQLVKRQTGDTAGFYIRRKIITEAKRKALHSDLSMKEIAFDLGFYSEAHFSVFFKNYMGVSFSEFRRGSKERGNVFSDQTSWSNHTLALSKA